MGAVQVSGNLERSILAFEELTRPRARDSVTRLDHRLALGHFVADHKEMGQVGRAEGCGESHVGGVSAHGHKDSADPRGVVASIEGPPAAG